jgi:serine/threonine protein kinase
MASIPYDALMHRTSGPVAEIFLLPGERTRVVKVYPQALDRRTFNGVEVEQARLAGLRAAGSVVLVEGYDELPDGRTGLRMEFCPQGLPELVAGGPLPIGDVLVLGQILASVLAQAHEIGLVHGGLTPANVVERASGQPALSDFGVSLRLRFPRDLMADAAYTAPEVLRDGELSEQADVYGLGAVLYLALVGHSPFPARTGETPDDVVLRVLREAAPAVSGRDVPAAFSELLGRMLAKEPTERPEAVEVVAALEALLLQGDGTTADEFDFDDFRDELAAARVAEVAPLVPTPVVKTPRTRRAPSKGLVIGAAAVVALLAVAVPVMFGGEKQQSEPQQNKTSTSTPSTVPSTPAVELNLLPPKDNGTSVSLQWTSSKPLTYAVYVAEQGGKGAQTSYKGSGTSLTVNVVPGLKYCFEVQGTDGHAIYMSKPLPIRGATCDS